MRSLIVAAVLMMAWVCVPSARAGVQPAPSRSVPADTLRYSVPSGEALIVTLPASYRGATASYRIVQAPALSWVVDRSFFWQTRRGEYGVMLVELDRGSSQQEADRLVLRIEILGG